MSEDRSLRVQRQMAWERAKGELNSMLCTYFGNPNYDAMNKELSEFIKNIEDEGLAE